MLTILPIVKPIQVFYTNSGFRIKVILTDNQFEPMCVSIDTDKVGINYISKG